MDVHASPDEWPELKEVLGSFQVRFRWPEGAEALERDTTGRLTEWPHKHCDPIAPAVPSTSEQGLQELLTNRPWDEADLNGQRVQKLVADATLGDGVLGLDDPGFPTQGTASVGVARQYAGTLGQVGHGQIAGPCGDTAPQATWPVAVHVYVPPAWAEAPERRRNARVPAEVPCQPTPAMALAVVDHARAWGGPDGGVVAAADGDTPNVLAGLDARHARDVVAVRPDVRVRRQRRTTGPVARTDEPLQRVPRAPWRTMRGRQGPNGWWRKPCVAVRCWRITSAGRRHVGWRRGERAPQGQPAERKDSWSHLPALTRREELAEDAHRRYAIEPCHEEAKGELGWDPYQGRRWPGFHRQAVTGMLASSVLVWLERYQRHHQHRRGRPRNPCSPAAGSPEAHAPRGPSRGRPVAPPPGRAVVGDDGSVHRTLLTKILTKQY